MIHQCYGESIAMTKIITKIQVFPGRLALTGKPHDFTVLRDRALYHRKNEHIG